MSTASAYERSTTERTPVLRSGRAGDAAAAPKTAAMSAAGLDPAVDGFLALLATRRAPRTVEAYRRDLQQLTDFLGASPSLATTEDLERYLADLRAAGRAPATIARRIAATRAF
jgi:DNA replication initiation complex subunit (GINS family)